MAEVMGVVGTGAGLAEEGSGVATVGAGTVEAMAVGAMEAGTVVVATEAETVAEARAAVMFL